MQIYIKTLHIFQLSIEGLSHIPETMDGIGAEIVTVYDSFDTYLATGVKCTIENGMTSLTVEQYGLIDRLLALNLLLLKHDTPINGSKVTFWIDNTEVHRKS